VTFTTSQQTTVRRTAAIGLLDLAFHQRITMVVAPAGSGKTETLRQWARQHGPNRVGWITITPGPGLMTTFLADLHRNLPPMAREGDVTIVVDDFHHAGEDAATDIAGVLSTLPDNVHIVLAGRKDPPIACYRLGHPGLLVEVRQDALAFDDDEAAALVGDTVDDARLRAADGWVTGLLLGDDELARYFDHEVLHGLDDDVVRFLVETSVLRELTGSLCDAVTGRPGSDAMLARLRKASLFLSRSAGSTRHRYHEQFRAHVRAMLHRADREREATLLVRAATWYVDHDELDAGMAALVEAGAWDELFDAAFAHAPRLLAAGRAAAVAHWLACAPDAARRRRPDILVLQSAAALFGDDPARAVGTLDAFDRLDREAFRIADGERTVADLLRGYLALQRGAVWQAVAASDRVVRAVERREAFDGPNVFGLTGCGFDVLAAAGVLRGVGLVYEGRLEEARAALEPATQGVHALWQVSALGALAVVEAWSGSLGRAEQLAAQALATADELALHAELATTSAYLALAIVSRERDDLVRARAFLDGATLGSGPGQSRLVDSAVVLEDARLAAACGDPERGMRVLRSRGDLEHPSMPLRVVNRRRAVQAQLQLLLGDVDDAAAAVDAFGLTDDHPDIAVVRVRLAVERHDAGAARRIVDAWTAEGTTVHDRVERHLWRAVVAHLEGDERDARAELASAVAEAEPERDLGPFRRAGAHVLGPARALYRTTPTPFVRSIVEQPPAPVRTRTSAHLVEQLTHREYLVLSLLPTRLSNAEIAEQLEISLNTVKTHLKHIYRKLDVPGRREAVSSAEQLRLL
jgi:LuxR family maltose regulon positive regulatory protein